MKNELNVDDIVLILDNAVGWKGLAKIKKIGYGYDLAYINAPKNTKYLGPYRPSRFRKLSKLELALYKMKCHKNE